MQPHGAEAAGHAGELDVLTEEELIETLKRRLELIGWNVQQHHVARLEHLQVGEHPPLRGEPRRVAAGPRRERLHVGGEESLEKGGAVPPAHADLRTLRDRADYRVLSDDKVLLCGGLIRCQ